MFHENVLNERALMFSIFGSACEAEVWMCSCVCDGEPFTWFVKQAYHGAELAVDIHLFILNLLFLVFSHDNFQETCLLRHVYIALYFAVSAVRLN